MKGYLRQLKYCNQVIRQITTCLLGDSTRNKIIIFQGDHGYRDYSNAPVDKAYHALSAIYFPDGNYDGLSKDLSHVNTYRVILNKFFGTALPILKDSIVIKKND